MDANKENAQRALEAFDRLFREPKLTDSDFVREFLQAAIKRLPHQESIDRDRERKKHAKEIEAEHEARMEERHRTIVEARKTAGEP